MRAERPGSRAHTIPPPAVVDELGDLDEGDGRADAVQARDALDELLAEELARRLVALRDVEVDGPRFCSSTANVFWRRPDIPSKLVRARRAISTMRSRSKPSVYWNSMRTPSMPTSFGRAGHRVWPGGLPQRSNQRARRLEPNSCFSPDERRRRLLERAGRPGSGEEVDVDATDLAVRRIRCSTTPRPS